MDERPSPAIAFALVAGVCGAVQPKVNAVLGDRVGSGLIATTVNFVVALLCISVVLGFRRSTRHHLWAVRRWEVPWWSLTAGLCGAIVVLSAVVTVQTIGVAIFSVAFFAGQISSGLVVDRLAVGGRAVLPFTRRRLVAAVLALSAVALTQVGREAGELAPALVAFVVFAGAAAAFQAAFNARFATAVGDPLAPTAVNIVVGTVALSGVVLVVAVTGGVGPLSWPPEPWLYLGGTMGVAIVLAIAVASAAIGVLSATLAMLAAQLVGAVAVDWVIEGAPPTIGVVGGSVLVVVAAALVTRQRSVGAGLAALGPR